RSLPRSPAIAPAGTMAMPIPARTKLIMVANWVTVATWWSVCPAAAAAPSIIRRVRDSRPLGCSRERMTARQDDVKYLTAHGPCLTERRQVIHLGGAKIGGPTADVL